MKEVKMIKQRLFGISMKNDINSCLFKDSINDISASPSFSNYTTSRPSL